MKKLCYDFNLVVHSEPLGLAKTVQDSWRFIPQDIDYILHVEDDFLFNQKPNLEEIIYILESHDYLSQMIFMRQPVNFEEQIAGSYIKQFPDAYTQINLDNYYWIENNRFFSLNPGLIPRKIFDKYGWPDGNEAEMTAKLNEDGFRHGIWGKKDDAPIVEHIGVFRPEWWKL